MKFKFIMVVILVMLVPAGCFSPGSANAGQVADFKDVKGHWGENAIYGAAAKGYVTGYPDGTFKPDRQVTRAEFATMLTKSIDLFIPDGHNTDWFSPYVRAITTDGELQPGDFEKQDWNKPMTRFELVRMATRSINPGLQKTGTDDAQFMYEATTSGIVHGLTGGELGPDKTTTRAQAVTVIEKVLQLRAGGKLDTDPKAIENAKMALYHNNLDKFGFTDIVQFPITVEDKGGGLKVTIHSIYGYDVEASKPIVDKYGFEAPLNREKKKYNIVPVYKSEEFSDGYTLFMLDMTLENTGNKVAGLFFDKLDEDFAMVTGKAGISKERPGEFSQYRKGLNRTDYTSSWKLNKGESFRTSQAFIFHKGDLEGFLRFVTNNNAVDLAIIPDSAKR